MVGHIGRIEAALLCGPAVALVMIQFYLLLTLTIERESLRVVVTALNRLGVYRLARRRSHYYVFLGIGLIGVVITRCQEQQ